MRVTKLIPSLIVALVTLCASGLTSAQETTEAQPPAEADAQAAEPGLAQLDEAMQTKLGAVRLKDLERVVELCEAALKAGLSEANQAFAKQMLTSTLYERAERLVEPVLSGNFDQTSVRRREMGLESLRKVIELDDKHGDAYLLLAKLCGLSEGDAKAGRVAAANAVDLLRAVPARKSEALVVQAQLAETPEERIKILDQAIAADAGNFDAWSDRGDAKLVSGDTEGAVADFKHILEKDEDNVEALQQIVRAMAANEKFDEAREYIDRVIELEPESPIGYAMRSSIYLMQERQEDALDDLDTAVELDPGNVGIRLTRAQVLELNEDYDEALADIDRVLELRPGLTQAVLLRAEIAISAERLDEAILAFKELLDRDPENSVIRLQLASLYTADERPRRAIQAYTKMLEEEDFDQRWRALQGRADASLSIGAHAEAVTDYEQALKLAPDDDGILNNLAWVLSTSPKDNVRDGKRSIDLAKKACELTNYEAAHILSTLAACYAEAGDFEEAKKWSGKAVELGEGELKDQLAEELESYEQGKPWRELQEQQENQEPEPELGLNDDLMLEEPLEPDNAQSDDTNTD